MVRFTTVDLRAEAIAEARRVNAVRALLRDGDARTLVRLEGDGTWIATSRRSSLKRSLGRRVCQIWRVAFVDASGRLVETKIVPVLVEGPRRSGDLRRTASIRLFLQQADAVVRARVEARCEAWRTEVVGIARTFSSARLERHREAAERRDPGPLESQPGLFDRRVERSRDTRAAAAEEAEKASAARLLSIQASAQIAPAPARLMLVLVP